MKKNGQKASGVRRKAEERFGGFPSSRKPLAFSPEQGFTLLEVMIALAIIATALVTLLGLGNRSIAVNRETQQITQATLLAQQRMSEIEVEAARPGFQLSEEDGTFEAPFDGFRWRIAYEDTPLPLLRIVTVTVSWGEEAKNEMVDLASFVFTQ